MLAAPGALPGGGGGLGGRGLGGGGHDGGTLSGSGCA